MKKHLFLSGPSGCGKSTLLRNALGERMASAGGFLTERLLDAEGQLLGFALRSPSCLPGSGRMFIDFRTGVRDNCLFGTLVPEILEQSMERPFAVLDETGGMEVCNSAYCEAFFRFLQSGPPCIGVLKTPEDVRRQSIRLGLDEAYQSQAAAFRQRLLENSSCMILETAGRYDDEALRIVEAWVSEFTGEERNEP